MSAAICGKNKLFEPQELEGCGQPIVTCAEVYRCADCAVPFHRDCAKRHFASRKVVTQDVVDSATAAIAKAKGGAA